MLAVAQVGTPYYLSPEICEDKPYDQKSDVWSLGCILYEMATLKRAFNGQSLPALVLKILRGKYPPLPARYSGSLKTLVDCMLKIKPQVLHCCHVAFFCIHKCTVAVYSDKIRLLHLICVTMAYFCSMLDLNSLYQAKKLAVSQYAAPNKST